VEVDAYVNANRCACDLEMQEEEEEEEASCENTFCLLETRL
jgi:hypothetical protein